MYSKIVFPSLLQQFWKCLKLLFFLFFLPKKKLVFGDEFLAQGLHLGWPIILSINRIKKIYIFLFY